jgi:hypothetical protein
MPIKSFRGLLADGTVEKIRLSTTNGLTGYKIVKFELFPFQPGQATTENTVTVHTIEPAASTSAVEVNFNSPTLLAAGTFHESHADNLVTESVVVFDNVVFNQDIFVAHTDTGGAIPVNFYLELEQVKLDLNEATVATLKDMRANYTNLDP